MAEQRNCAGLAAAYTDTFAPTPSQTVIKILLAHAAQQLLLVYQYDFKTAFLNSLIDEEEQIYVEQPHGFEVNEGRSSASSWHATHGWEC